MPVIRTYIEDITWLRGDMKFIFECSVYYINLLITMFLTIFRRLPTIFRRFLKICKMLSEGRTNVSEHFPNFSENFRRYPKIAAEDPKMFRLNIDLLWLIQHTRIQSFRVPV